MLHSIPMVSISYSRKVKVKTTEVRENHTYTVTCSITWVSSEHLIKHTYMQWIHCFDIFSMAKRTWFMLIAQLIVEMVGEIVWWSTYLKHLEAPWQFRSTTGKIGLTTIKFFSCCSFCCNGIPTYLWLLIFLSEKKVELFFTSSSSCNIDQKQLWSSMSHDRKMMVVRTQK